MSDRDRDRRRRERRREDRDREGRRRRRRSTSSEEGADEPVRGFRPQPWMTGKRPGENLNQSMMTIEDSTTKPLIQICKLRWDDKEAMELRVGGLIPQHTSMHVGQRFSSLASAAAIDITSSKEDETLEQLNHLANLYTMGVPVQLVFPQLESLCQEYQVALIDPPPEDENPPPGSADALSLEMYGSQRKGHQGMRPRDRDRDRDRERDRELDHVIENQWSEVPLRVTASQSAHNPASACLLVAMLPSEHNNEESLRKHFSQFGIIEQVFPRINYRPAPRFAKNGAAIIEMCNKFAAAQAQNSTEPVCGNRFIKVFYAPEEARKKVEQMKLSKLLDARKAQIDKTQALKKKLEDAIANEESAKARMVSLMGEETKIKAEIANSITSGDTESKKLFEEQLQNVHINLKAALKDRMESMALQKQAAQEQQQQQQQQQPWKQQQQQQNRMFGRHAYDARTPFLKLPKLIASWVQNPYKLKHAMQTVGEIEDCVVGGNPPQGFVQFKTRREAEEAFRILEQRMHAPQWLEKLQAEAEWPSEDQIIKSIPPQPEVKEPSQSEIPKDDDEALIEAELGILDEIIPRADVPEDTAMSSPEDDTNQPRLSEANFDDVQMDDVDDAINTDAPSESPPAAVEHSPDPEGDAADPDTEMS
eukprot:TRINITY_DN14990_c1_g1_i1.p1 TRINITY_DN14990_c1_g1~~TRINITY_DN14990_c1_g1_i1.p1  ORF type:complete len:712 (+),score=166.60 TRINITY_DN14990_c1_g1_i1:191-2137(+)